MHELLAEGSAPWEAYAKAQGLAPFFVVTEWNVAQLQPFLTSFPHAHVLFSCHYHDVLPAVSAQTQAQLHVPTEAHRQLAKAYGAHAERIQVMEAAHLWGETTPLQARPIERVVVIAETHPYGGLVSALALLQQCRQLGAGWQIFEHAVSSREMFPSLLKADPHAFPRRPAEFSFAWREELTVKPAPPRQAWGAETAFLWLPLHVAPPLSLNVVHLQRAGYCLATMQGPWSLATPRTQTFSPDSWSAFDPLRLPHESPVNRGIALGHARRLLTAWSAP